MLVAVAFQYGNDLTAQTDLGDGVNTWTMLATAKVSNVTKGGGGLWVCKVAAGGLTTITFTSSANPPTGDPPTCLIVYELSGADPNTNPDVYASGAATSYSTNVAASAFTTGSSGDFLLAFMGQGYTTTVNTPGAGWTIDLNYSGATNYGYATEYIANAPTGTSFTGAFTTAVGTPWVAFAIAVKARVVPSFYSNTRDPLSTDCAPTYSVGDVWLNSSTGVLWECLNNAAGAAVWRHYSIPNVTTNAADPTPTNDGNTAHSIVYSVGDVWLNTADGKLFQCRDNATNSAKWALLNSALTPKDFGARGDNTADDSASIMTALLASQLPKFQNGVFFPGGQYLVSDTMAGNANTQMLTIDGTPSTGWFTLTVTSFGLGVSPSTQTTATISPTATPTTVQAALAALTNVGNNVAVYGPTGGGPPWVIVFDPIAPTLKGVVMSFTPNLPAPYKMRVGNANIQTVNVTGSSGTFALTVTATGISTATATQTTGQISITAPDNPNNGVNSVQSYLGQLTNVTEFQVWVIKPSPGTYTVYYSPYLGAPAMSASGSGGAGASNLISQAGAAIFLSGVSGLRLFGEAQLLSTLAWHPANGSIGGIMLALDHCSDVAVENLAISGATGGNQPRIGVVFSDVNGAGATNIIFRNDYLIGFTSLAAAASPPLLASCVQFALNVLDRNGDSGKFFGCTFVGAQPSPTLPLPPCAGVRVVARQSVNHQMVACDMYYLDVGVHFHAGGNFQWLGGALEGLRTVLKLGTGSDPNQGGGPNDSTFILQNLRTEAANISTNTVVVDTGFIGPAGKVIIEGWDDSTPIWSNEVSPAIRVGASANVVMRNPLFQRPVLAAEIVAGAIAYVTLTNPGSYTTSTPPSVAIGGGGTGAQAQAVMSQYQTTPTPLWWVSYIIVTAAGSGYTSPTATISGGNPNVAATATATLVAGVPPAAGAPALLRLENVTGWVGPTGAACSQLTANTKIDLVAGGTVEVSTVIGHGRYSKLDWAVLQLGPKNFWDLGDIGLTAPNRGSNFFNSNVTPPYNDGQYFGTVAGPLTASMTQNAQGIVATDAIGGFNTRPATGGSTQLGYVTFGGLNSAGLGLAPALTGSPVPGWTLLGLFLQNSVGNAGGYPIVSNLASGAAAGFEVGLSSATSPQFYAQFSNLGTVQNFLSARHFGGTAPFSPVLFMVVLDPPGTLPHPNIYFYFNGNTTPDLQTAYTAPLLSEPTSTIPRIGSSPATSGIADLGIARVATFDAMVSPSAFAGLWAALQYGR